MGSALAPGLAIPGGWRLVRRIGRGSMGEVWQAEGGRHEPVAIKFLGIGLQRDRIAVGRFDREWAMASNIDSPHAVRMIERGTTDTGRPFLVMELLEGETLEEEIGQQGMLSAPETVWLLRQVAHALDAAHRRGIVHRDVKPDNILLCRRDGSTTVKVLDFGLAKPFAGGQTLTATGLLVGTPYYMSPEQLRDGGRDVDHRADLWALGAVTYRMLFGCQPFDAETLPDLVHEIFRGAFRPLEEVGGPSGMSWWFERAFQPDRTKRFQSAGEMVDGLARQLLGTSAYPGAVAATLLLDEPESITITEERPLPRRESGDARLADSGTAVMSEPATVPRPRDDAVASRPPDTVTQPFPILPVASPSIGMEVEAAVEPALATARESPPATEPHSTGHEPSTHRLPTPRARRRTGWWLVAASALALAIAVGAWRAAGPPDVTPDDPPPPRPSLVPPAAAPETMPSTSPTPSASASGISSSASSANASASAAPSRDRHAYLTVLCEPACIVLVDRRRVGFSPVRDLPVTPGKHQVVGYRDDTGAKTVTVELDAGARETVTIHAR